ncbi:AMP-binding protein [Variovorax sp. E3]|uniref:AMP-binding protein n=1 Tax=Variovorax sp. E3 TaxID=1914993 RepID=UPI0022B618A2|nr:AMP-binding protein [Variovorax sp. E3]
MMPNCLTYPLALAAVLRAALVVVNVNPLYTPRELEALLEDSGAKCLVIAEPMLPSAEQILPRVALENMVIAPVANLREAPPRTKSDDLTNLGRPPASGVPRRVHLPIAISSGLQAVLEPEEILPSDPAFLQYTGGTTGVSKGAILTHRSFGASLRQIRSWVRLILPVDGISIVTPLLPYHVYPLAMALAALDLGANHRLIPNPRDTAGVIAELAREPFDMLIGVNSLFNSLVDDSNLANVDFSRTSLLTGAGASIQKAVGWMVQGDVVRMDEKGFMYIVDRKKDMIVVSGFNVYPNEIEAGVAMLPGVVECACVGVSDPRSGEAPHLFAVRRNPALTTDDIVSHCRVNLAATRSLAASRLWRASPKPQQKRSFAGTCGMSHPHPQPASDLAHWQRSQTPHRKRPSCSIAHPPVTSVSSFMNCSMWSTRFASKIWTGRPSTK